MSSTTILAVIVCHGIVAGCTREPPGTLHVEFGQCAAVTPGPTCTLPDDGRLRLWTDDPDAVISVEPRRLSTRDLRITVTEGGRLFDIEVPPQTRAIVLTAARATWRLPLAPPDETRHELSEQARALLRSEDYDRGIEMLGDSVTSLLEAGRTLEATRDGAARAYYLIHKQRRFAAADAELDRVAAAGPPSADAQYLLAYYRALVAFNSGDARRALPLLRKAAAHGARMEWPRRQFHSEQMLALQLQMLGRRREALELLESWGTSDLADFSACERAMFANNLGWSALLLLEAGEAAVNPVANLQATVADMDAHCVVAERVNLRINLALACFHAGDYSTARDYLAEASTLIDTPEPRIRLWSHDLSARLALGEGRHELALARYADLERLAAATLSPDASWRASVGRARVLSTRGDRDAALREFERAEAFLREDLMRIPIHEGRETFLAARTWATRERLTLLLDAGQNEQAFALVRRARLRTLRGLKPDDRLAALDPAAQARWYAAVGTYRRLREDLAMTVGEIWTVPRDQLEGLEAKRRAQEELLKQILDDAAAVLGTTDADAAFREPANAELMVTFYRLAADWAVFARTTAQLRVHRLVCDGAQMSALAACLLAPLVDVIDDAQRLRILLPDELAGIDLHAAALGDNQLVERVPVVYAADLPIVALTGATGNALLLADPGGNLHGARREVDAIGAVLAREGRWQLQAVSGEEATPLAIQRALEQADLFHFAGHARLDGTLGWDSALHFAAGAKLAVTDILAMKRVPRFVALSGCETGAARSSTSAVAGIGMAWAFFVSGSDEVLAATRPVRDETARRLMITFYEARAAGLPSDVALQRAQLALRSADPSADWAAFRLFVR